MSILEKILKGDVRVSSSFIRDIEDKKEGTEEVLSKLYPHTGKAHVIGITGPSGSGKSTLISGLISEFLAENKKIGVLCIDPLSPFSGGAFLGDRVRMKEHFTNKNVFIRSTSGRDFGSIIDIIRVIDAMGKNIILVETIGAGQDQVDIKKIVDTVVLVLSPGAGDDIQALKAGILEIPDFIVVNKKDKVESETLAGVIKETTKKHVFLTDSLKKIGIKELAGKIVNNFKMQNNKEKLKYELELKIESKIKKDLKKKLNKKFKEIDLAKNPYENFKELKNLF